MSSPRRLPPTRSSETPPANSSAESFRPSLVMATPASITSVSSQPNPRGARVQTRSLTLPYNRDIISYASALATKLSTTSSGRATPASTLTISPFAHSSTAAVVYMTLSISCTNLACSQNPESLAPNQTRTNSTPPGPPTYTPNEPLAWSLFSSIARNPDTPLGSLSISCPLPPPPSLLTYPYFYFVR